MPEISDDELIGEYWDLKRLDALTDDEKVQLVRYRRRTQGFEQRSLEFIAAIPQPDQRVDDHDAHAMLGHWNAAWKELRDWHHGLNDARAATAEDPDDRNPVSKVLRYEENAISNLSGKLSGRI
jgi:hypothetical protein